MFPTLVSCGSRVRVKGFCENQPGNALDWDRYAYVLWNPINLNDPTGNNPECGPDGVYCDHDNWNDYEYDPVPLSDGGKRIIRIAREIERLTGNNVNLSTLLRLVFEREFNGFGKLEGRGLKEAFIEAGVRNYLWWSDSRYHQQSNVTLINWLGDSQGVSYSLERELFINIPSGLRVVDQVIGKTRTYQYNAGVANTMAMQIQNPPEEWLKLDLDAPFGYAYCRSENECMIPYQNKQEEFWLLADTSKDNLGNYIFSTDIASTYFKSSISYIVTYRQAQYWNSP